MVGNRISVSQRADFGLKEFGLVAWATNGVDIPDSALEHIRWAREQFLSLLDYDPNQVIYGVTTGYGQKAKIQLTPEQRKAHAPTPSLAPATSFGEPLPDRVVRGILFARLTSFVSGNAAVTPELAVAVAKMLDADQVPEVPSLGTGGAGEIQPLSHLFSGISRVHELRTKEPLALVNGSPVASALIADAALAAQRRVALATEVFALSIEALKAPLDAYDSDLAALWDDPCETRILRQFSALLEGATTDRRPYQAPVSWRILPRVLGQTLRAARQAADSAETALRSITDNPVFIPPDPKRPDPATPHGRVLSNGSYQNARATPALDALAASYADLATLCDRHSAKLLDGAVSLLPQGLTHEDAPVGTYLGCIPMAAVGYAEQARHAAQTTLLPGSESGGFAANDISPPTLLAWRKQATAGHALDCTLAAVSSVAAQAFHVTDRTPPPNLQPLLNVIRNSIPPIEGP